VADRGVYGALHAQRGHEHRVRRPQPVRGDDARQHHNVGRDGRRRQSQVRRGQRHGRRTQRRRASRRVGQYGQRPVRVGVHHFDVHVTATVAAATTAVAASAVAATFDHVEHVRRWRSVCGHTRK